MAAPNQVPMIGFVEYTRQIDPNNYDEKMSRKCVKCKCSLSSDPHGVPVIEEQRQLLAYRLVTPAINNQSAQKAYCVFHKVCVEKKFGQPIREGTEIGTLEVPERVGYMAEGAGGALGAAAVTAVAGPVVATGMGVVGFTGVSVAIVCQSRQQD